MNEKEKKPNFIIFVVDEMQSFSLGCNGNSEIQTPNIDKLAAVGCTFQRAYCNNTVCMPSRATMLTGLMPKQHGCLTNGTRLPENVPTVTEALVKNGYRTHSIGKIHLQPLGTDNLNSESFSWESVNAWTSGNITKLPEMYYGFQTAELVNKHVAGGCGDYVNWMKEKHPDVLEKFEKKNAYYSDRNFQNCWRMDVPSELHYNNWIADRSMAFINDMKEEESFFLWCSFPDPHMPFAACKPYSEMYDPSKITLNKTWAEKADEISHLADRRVQFKHTNYSEETLREITAQTYGMITHIDHNIGRVMNHLEEKGLIDNTVIVFMADHGEYLGSHHLLYKAEWPYEELVRVPYIWKVPDAFKKGESSSQVVSLLDFVPTILDYANIEQSEMDFRGRRQAHPLGLPGRTLRPHLSSGAPLEERPAIIEYDEDWHPGPMYRIRIIVDDCYKLIIFGVGEEGILTDLSKDPNEMVNLWNHPEYTGIRAKLTEKLLFELIRTDRMDQPRLCGA